jgi:hypothetical protein
MHDQPDELLDRVYGHPHNRFSDHLGKRGVIGDIAIRDL